MAAKNIDIIPAHKINPEKWNACIDSSNAPLIYARTFYLNNLADNWHGIVMNDYEAVLPLPWRKKFGIRYTYDVPFIQQLGCFSKDNQHHDLLTKHLFRFCKYGDYYFNFSNKISNSIQFTNYVIDLSKTYAFIAAAYNEDLRNNLKKANKQSILYAEADYNTAIELYKDLYHQRMKNLTGKDFERFEKLCDYLSVANNVIVRKVTNTNSEMLSIALLLKDKHRFYNLMNSTTEAGRKTEANHFLYDNIFKEFAETQMLFDFEGSDIPGVKSFYEKFGAVNQPYCKLHFNHLPFPLNQLKR